METVTVSYQLIGKVSVLFSLVLLTVIFSIAGPRPGSRDILGANTREEAPLSEQIDPDVALALGAIQSREHDLDLPTVSDHSTTELAQNATPQAQSSQAISHIVKPGETLFNIWKHYGAPNVGGSKAAEAWKEAGVSLNSLRPGDELKLTVENGDILELRRRLKNGDEVILKGNSKNGYVASMHRVQVFETERTVSGLISTSFSASARSLAVPYSVIDELVDLFGSRIEFRRDLHPGDSFTITYKQRIANGSVDEQQSGMISAASITNSGKMSALIRHVGRDRKARYYNELGDPVGDYFLRYPVQFSRISSVFSTARLHPLLQRLRPHNGVDFAAPIGTPVRAVGDGVVTDAGYRGGAGNLIQIAHNGRYATAYLHLSKILSGLHAGSHVTRGQVIGAVGMTGLATGPHLHFALYDHGTYIDPLKASLPSLAAGDERIPQSVLVLALNSLRSSQQAFMLALATPAGKQHRIG